MLGLATGAECVAGAWTWPQWPVLRAFAPGRWNRPGGGKVQLKQAKRQF
jgi:hypothetical protein